MWMSDAPRFSESTRRTLVSLTTGAASADLARLPRSISSSSRVTVSTSASTSLIESRSISESPVAAPRSSTPRVWPPMICFRRPPPAPVLPAYPLHVRVHVPHRVEGDLGEPGRRPQAVDAEGRAVHDLL